MTILLDGVELSGFDHRVTVTEQTERGDLSAETSATADGSLLSSDGVFFGFYLQRVSHSTFRGIRFLPSSFASLISSLRLIDASWRVSNGPRASLLKK